MEAATSTPEGAATTVDESPKAPVRGPDGKFASAPSPAPEPGATPEPVTTDPKGDVEDKPEKQDEPKRNRAQERISQLTAEKHAAQRAARDAEQRFAALQRQMQERQTPDPNDYDAVQRESVRGVLQEETARRTADDYQQAVQKARQAQVDAFYAKVDAVRDRIPDIDRSLQTFSTLPVSDHAAEIIADSEVAAEMAHYLANNPREAFDIYQMSPAQQGRALAHIEQRVSIPTRRTTAAPQPPPTVTGAQAARAKSPSEMSAAEYIAMRKAEWKRDGR